MDFSMDIFRGAQKVMAEKMSRNAQHDAQRIRHAPIRLRIKKDLQRPAIRSSPLTNRTG
jgi:hypothetical protein